MFINKDKSAGREKGKRLVPGCVFWQKETCNSLTAGQPGLMRPIASIKILLQVRQVSEKPDILLWCHLADVTQGVNAVLCPAAADFVFQLVEMLPPLGFIHAGKGGIPFHLRGDDGSELIDLPAEALLR